jgi:hypothetical protein
VVNLSGKWLLCQIADVERSKVVLREMETRADNHFARLARLPPMPQMDVDRDFVTCTGNSLPLIFHSYGAQSAGQSARRRKVLRSGSRRSPEATFIAYFIAAAIEAMRSAPEVNSRWHSIYLEVFRDINIGVGAALGDKGLILPVTHQAQDSSLQGIPYRLQE